MFLTAALFSSAARCDSNAISPPVIDNERVTVWDVKLAQGVAGPETPHDLDAVIMFLEGGQIRTAAHGKVRSHKRAFGAAVFVPKGTDSVDTLMSSGAAREIIVAFKDVGGHILPNGTGYPAAFPRPGSVKTFENDEVVTWHYSWTPNVPTPMHFHDKDVVVAYRQDGDLKSVTASGETVVNAYKTGDIRFNKANRAHFEVLTTAHQSAVMAELK